MLFYFAKNTINGGGGGGSVSQFWTRVALDHVNDMRCVEKEYAFLLD